MTEELKPCPRCNGKILSLFNDESKTPYGIMCCKCGIRTMNHNSKEKAIEDWNRRVKDD